MGRKKDDDQCPICGRLFEARVVAYRDSPFIDGRCYEAICIVCNDVPNMYRFDPKTETLTVYRRWDPGRLQTVEAMLADGWDKREATNSIKAVKQAIKRKLGKNPAPDPNPEVLWTKYYGDDPQPETEVEPKPVVKPEPPKKTRGKKKPPPDEELALDEIFDLEDEARPKKPPKYGVQAKPRAKAG